MAPSVPVLCVPNGRRILLRPGETILDGARRSGVPLASSCSGAAVCGDCLVTVIAGLEGLPPPDPEEEAWRVRRRYAGPGRLACRVTARAPCSIATTYW